MSMSSVALRAQIASVIDALCKAAVAEIAKVVEDGMAVLRLEMCQRDSEIQQLKSNVEVLHGELTSARERLTRRPGDRGRDESQSDVGDARTLLEKVQAVQDPSCASTPEVKVKCEPTEEGGKETGGRPDQLALFDRDSAQWLPAAQTQAGRGESDFLNMGPNALLCLPETPLDAAVPSGGPAGFHPGPFGRGPLGHSQYRNLNNAAWRRTVKRLMFKKGFLCPYCGKYFERSGHLERHKRIHTGEKPYRCEICGRRFNQNCSLKEHTKIHRRNIQPRPVEIQVAEQKHVPEVNPCSDPARPEEASQMSAEDGLPKNEDILSTPVQVKSEPLEENITQPPFQGGTGQAMEGVDSLGENFAAFERDGQQWMSRLHGPNGSEISSTEYPGGSAQSAPSFPAMAQLLPPPVDASCGTFQFPGKPHGELKNSLIPQTPYGSSDPLMMSGEAGLHGLVGATLNHHHHPRASRSFQVIKPKKSFVCSYCAKVFERAGHLERHLRIHTGEKPYGCHICGRCFNQKSSLKGHMKTHRNGENADVLDAPHMMFTIPDNQLLKNLAEPTIGLAAPEEQVPGSTYSEPAAEQTVVVKLEPNGDDFQAVGQAGTENGTGAPDHDQLWTSGMEKSGDGGQQGVCLLLQDVKYHLSPVAGATSEQPGYTSPIKDLPFLDHKEKEEMLHTDQFAVMAMQAGGSDMTLAPELQDHHLMQEVTVSDYAALSDRPHEGGVFEFNMAADDHEDNRGGADATRQNCFICSCCGQSFDSFGLFQRHQCADVAEPSFSCGTCGKVFNQMSILKLHQKLHAE